MKPATYFLIGVLWLGLLVGCSSARKGDSLDSVPTAPVNSIVKIKVGTVFNSSDDLYDVDVIGLLWNGINESLKKRGMLWSEPTTGPTYTIDAHVVHYQRGNVWIRNVMPWWGKSELAVRCELKQEGQVIATAESRQTISMGSFSKSAWLKVFSMVSEDIVSKLLRSI